MLGEAIRQLRKKSGLTLKDLGQSCGVSHVTVSRYERGERSPSSKMLRCIAESIGVSVEEINQLAEQLKPEPKPTPPESSPTYVTTDAQLAAWQQRLTGLSGAGGIGDPNQLLVMLVLGQYLDRTSWVVSGTLAEIAQSAALPVGLVEDVWPDILQSPFVERVGSAEWVLRLVFRKDEGGEGRTAVK